MLVKTRMYPCEMSETHIPRFFSFIAKTEIGWFENQLFVNFKVNATPQDAVQKI